ncbi:MAG: hypothetical protein U1E50_12215 [Caulobacteraceae bacterium]
MTPAPLARSLAAALAGLAALALAACNPDAMRDVRTANHMLSDASDPRYCGGEAAGCAPPVPGAVQQRVAACAIQAAETGWRSPPEGLRLPETRLTFAEAMFAMDARFHARSGGVRKPADDPADEDAAAARLLGLFNAAVPGCLAKTP